MSPVALAGYRPSKKRDTRLIGNWYCVPDLVEEDVECGSGLFELKVTGP